MATKSIVLAVCVFMLSCKSSSNSNHKLDLVGGKPAEINAWNDSSAIKPYLANLRGIINIVIGLESCSAVVIKPHYILSAYHCYAAASANGQNQELPMLKIFVYPESEPGEVAKFVEEIGGNEYTLSFPPAVENMQSTSISGQSIANQHPDLILIDLREKIASGSGLRDFFDRSPDVKIVQENFDFESSAPSLHGPEYLLAGYGYRYYNPDQMNQDSLLNPTGVFQFGPVFGLQVKQDRPYLLQSRWQRTVELFANILLKPNYADIKSVDVVLDFFELSPNQLNGVGADTWVNLDHLRSLPIPADATQRKLRRDAIASSLASDPVLSALLPQDQHVGSNSGDSGGPLFGFTDNGLVLYGILSQGLSARNTAGQIYLVEAQYCNLSFPVVRKWLTEKLNQ